MLNNGLTLKERVDLVRSKVFNTQSEIAAINVDLLNRWQSQRPFNDKSIFSERLSSAELSKDVFEAAISLDLNDYASDGYDDFDIAAQYRQGCKNHPDWHSELSEIFPYRADGLEAFPALLGPVIISAIRRLRKFALNVSKTAPIEPLYFVNSAAQYLTGNIARIAQRTLLRELHKARVSGILEGDTPQDRFSYFCDLLTDQKVAVDLLRAYPVLSRQLAQNIAQWEVFVRELIGHFADDYKALQSTFDTQQKLDVLQEVSLEAGDQHCDGRTVSFLHFSSGKKIVYKPHSLAVDQAFHELLAWLGKNGSPIDLKAPKVLDRGHYGWAEFIEPETCRSKKDVEDFFRRQGALLTLFYLLCANDFHHENVIASGAYPVPVDLETLLQPNLTLAGLAGGTAAPGNEIYNTVLNAGFLPQRIWGNSGEQAGVDLSGISAGDVMSPVKSLVLEDSGTDQMRLVRKYVPMPPGDHMVTLNDAPVAVEDYVAEITRGFSETYQFLSAHKQALLAAKSPLAAFENVETRVLLRATYYYALLLSDSFHPDLMADGLERDLFLDRLWLDVPSRKLLAKVVEAERQDMWRKDIPRFTMRPGECHLWTASNEKISDVWRQSPMELMRSKLQSFGTRDHTRQRWLTEKTLGTIALKKSAGGFEGFTVTEMPNALPRQDILAEAQKIADRICDLSFEAITDDSFAWMTCSPAGTSQWLYQEMGNDLYNGLPGLCLFFAYMGSVTNEAKYTTVARGAWKTIERQVNTGDPYHGKSGGFTGWGGLLYAAHHLDHLWPAENILKDILCHLPSSQRLVHSGPEFDLIDGHAGFIASALNLVEAGHSQLLDHCVACGDHLLANSIEQNNGVGWRLDVAGGEPLGGFSHGTAGIAWVLLRLAKHTNDLRFRDTALKALSYDRSLFCEGEGNWQDMREGMRPGETEVSDGHFVVAWCHGAPGIGLSRLLISELYSDALLEQEISAAIRKTREAGFGRNHSLCHGDLGNVELLRKAANIPSSTITDTQCERLLAGIVASGRENGWQCGYPPGMEPLGLMVGLSGIGFGLLKQAAWDCVPSVLALEPPQ